MRLNLKYRLLSFRTLLLAGLMLLFFNGMSQTTGMVYFIGIGIENTQIPNAPTKGMAKNDVAAVLAKTKNDLVNERISYFSPELNKQIRYSDMVTSCLYDESATIEAIELMFNEISSKANPYDIFYFYINAPSDGKTGTFYLPSSPLKKGEKSHLQSMLDPGQLHNLFSKISCRNQLIIVDDASWKTFHSVIAATFFQSLDKQKSQVLVVPSIISSDTFSVGNNGKTGLLASLISSTETSMLYVFDETGVNDIDDALAFSAYDLTKKKRNVVTFYTSFTTAGPGTLVDVSAKDPKSSVDISPIAKVAKDTKPDVLEVPKAKEASRGPISVDGEKVVVDSIVGTIRNYALIVGVSDYSDSAWPDLANPVFDATSFNDELKDHYGFETAFLKNPTKSELFKALTGLLSKNFDKNSQVVIFFAGHGGKNEYDGYFVPSDGKNPKSDPESNSYITYGTLQRIIKGLPSQHVLLMIDACYSGTFDEDVFASTRELAPEANAQMNRLRMINEKMHYQFKAYIASGITPVSDGKPGEHSPFMKEVLECLRKGYSENSIITFYAISAAVGTITTPVPRCSIISKEPGGDFLFIPQVKK
ncbi:hypothetical protein BH09BAC5_BH09BAC5_06560 [soil metagenome]